MISVIIPIFNEEEYIKPCLRGIYKQKSDYEIIIVDYSSADSTIKIAKKYSKVRVIKSKKGRVMQMNTGTIKAKGDILLFLHADTIMPTNAFVKIESSIGKGFIGGGFLQRFSEKNFLLRLVSLRSNLRTLTTHIFFGDQAMFVRKDIFEKLNGFRDIPIMEDLEFSKRMKKEGKVSIIKNKVFISGRNYLRNGILKLTFIYFILMVMYHLGFDYKKIKKVHDLMVK